MNSVDAWSFAPKSVEAALHRPGEKIFCSTDVGWRSLLLGVHRQPGFVEHYETLPTPDALLVVVLEGNYELECLRSGIWRRVAYRAGVGGVTAPHSVDCLRWLSSSSQSPHLVRINIPCGFLEEAHEEYRRIGQPSSAGDLNLLSFSDALVATLANELVQAARSGAPNLFAEAAAQLLSVHLLRLSKRLRPEPTRVRRVGKLYDFRLRRVVDFISEHFAENVSNAHLAKEAGLSKFHFARLFRERMGQTPFQHITDVRLAHAQELLCHTDLSIVQIGNACGYVHDGYFASIFRQNVGLLPKEFRKRERR